jgi:hypothetical protein
LIVSLTLTGFIVFRNPEFGKGKKLIPANLNITPPLRLLDFTQNHTLKFTAPFSVWVFNHALIDISIENIQVTAHLLDNNNNVVPNFEVTGKTGQLYFKASTNSSFESAFQGTLNFTIATIRKDFIQGVFQQCLNSTKIMKARYHAKIFMNLLTTFGIYPEKDGETVIDCPDFANTGLLSEKLANTRFPRLAARIANKLNIK